MTHLETGKTVIATVIGAVDGNTDQITQIKLAWNGAQASRQPGRA